MVARRTSYVVNKSELKDRSLFIEGCGLSVFGIADVVVFIAKLLSSLMKHRLFRTKQTYGLAYFTPAIPMSQTILVFRSW